MHNRLKLYSMQVNVPTTISVVFPLNGRDKSLSATKLYSTSPLPEASTLSVVASPVITVVLEAATVLLTRMERMSGPWYRPAESLIVNFSKTIEAVRAAGM